MEGMPDRLQEAFDAHRAAPEAFGPCLRALRALAGHGLLKEAASVARAYAVRRGSAPEAGDLLLDFVRRAAIERFPSGVALIREGDEGDEVFLILDGKVRVRRLGAGALAELTAGRLVGEVAPLARTRRTASVYAAGDVVVLRLLRADVARVVAALPAVAGDLARVGRSRLLAQVATQGSVLDALSESERHALFAVLEPRSVPEDTVLLREGAASKGLFLLVSGMARVSRGTPAGPEVLAELGPGSVLGEASLVLSRGATATITAATPLTYLELPPQAFAKALGNHPEAKRRLMEMMKSRLAQVAPPMAGSPSAVARVALVRGGKAPTVAEVPWHAQPVVEINRAIREVREVPQGRPARVVAAPEPARVARPEAAAVLRPRSARVPPRVERPTLTPPAEGRPNQRVLVGERQYFSGQRCPVCGFSDAGAMCVACGTVLTAY